MNACWQQVLMHCMTKLIGIILENKDKQITCCMQPQLTANVRMSWDHLLCTSEAFLPMTVDGDVTANSIVKHSTYGRRDVHTGVLPHHRNVLLKCLCATSFGNGPLWEDHVVA